MTYDNLLYERRGPVTLITIDRPERMNAIDATTHRELVDAWDRFRTDDDAYVAVLTGAGDRAFCAGGDLKAAFAGDAAGGPPPESWPPTRAASGPACSGPRAGPTCTSRRSRRSTAWPTRAAWSGPAGPTCARRRARHVRCHLPALEHRAGGRRDPAAAAHRRLPPGDGADRHGPRDRRARGRADRPGQRGRARPAPAWTARSSWPSGSPRCPSPRSAPTRRRRCAASGRPLDEGLRIEAECFNRLLDQPEIQEGLRDSTSATTPIAGRTGPRSRPAWPGEIPQEGIQCESYGLEIYPGRGRPWNPRTRTPSDDRRAPRAPGGPAPSRWSTHRPTAPSTAPSCASPAPAAWPPPQGVADAPRPEGGASGSSTPGLDEFGRDLTAEAAAGRIDPVIGRDGGDRADGRDPRPPAQEQRRPDRRGRRRQDRDRRGPRAAHRRGRRPRDAAGRARRRARPGRHGRRQPSTAASSSSA